MSSDWCPLLFASLLAGGLGHAPLAAAAPELLMVEPSTCVSLSEGRTCYLDTRIHWQVNSVSEHCLFVAGSRDPLYCAAGGGGQLDYAFSGEESLQFELRNATGAVVANTEIQVSWVYNGNQRRRNWRLF
ncbi:MAG: DUF3019 domain-containing protein [Gammaproteobacteria bacterium]|nr:DUF3019 domain-containing protein [Gammaproteobacteria bacterium]